MRIYYLACSQPTLSLLRSSCCCNLRRVPNVTGNQVTGMVCAYRSFTSVINNALLRTQCSLSPLALCGVNGRDRTASLFTLSRQVRRTRALIHEPRNAVVLGAKGYAAATSSHACLAFSMRCTFFRAFASVFHILTKSANQSSLPSATPPV